MDLNVLWFILIAVLFVGFFFLEGFDYGVGMLLPFIGRNDSQRRVVINTIGPFWDGNEVWLLTAGGAIFAAFPNWYATMFSGFYLALVLMLFALIVRAVAFEFRSKAAGATWRSLWDWAIFFGSLVPALLWGVAVANLMRGVPIDGKMNYVGGFWNLLNGFALAGGAAFVALFLTHGAIFLMLKSEPEVADRARRALPSLWVPAVALVLVFAGGSYLATDLFARQGLILSVAVGIAAVCLLASGPLALRGRIGTGFLATGLTIALVTAAVFAGMFPRVMISSLDPTWSLTIYDASSSQYTLTVMTFVALVFVPIVLLYQGWSYWVFRKRVLRTGHLEY